jgi:hypothetical protein
MRSSVGVCTVFRGRAKMPAVIRVVAVLLCALAAVWLACALPVDEKTGCVTSSDCVDDRVCIDAQCTSGACGNACLEACDRLEDCGWPVAAACKDDCLLDGGVLPAFTADDCKRQWDVLAVDEDDCDAATCLTNCRALCRLAAECHLIVDAPACTVGCQEAEDGCPSAVPDGCAEVPAAVQCYEAGDC